MRNHEIIQKNKLLDENGMITEPGYAKKLILEYDRASIKAPGWRIKEWDYYLITNGRYAVALTVTDCSYMGMLSASWIDLTAPEETTVTTMMLRPRFNLPGSSASGDVKAVCKNGAISYKHTIKGRFIECRYDLKGKELRAEFEIFDIPDESMVIATPFHKKGYFYYNQKINCMKAKGFAEFGGQRYEFSEDDTTAMLDWGRGAWTFANTWYWATASGYADGVPFGFNLGYGFGDTSAATENMIFYNGRAHKMDDADFGIPKKPDGKYDYMKQWHFTSSDKRIDFTFDPIIDRKAKISAVIIKSDQHQVFGRANGYAVLDSGERIKFSDLLASCEVIYNRF